MQNYDRISIHIVEMDNDGNVIKNIGTLNDIPEFSVDNHNMTSADEKDISSIKSDGTLEMTFDMYIYPKMKLALSVCGVSSNYCKMHGGFALRDNTLRNWRRKYGR